MNYFLGVAHGIEFLNIKSQNWTRAYRETVHMENSQKF